MHRQGIAFVLSFGSLVSSCSGEEYRSLRIGGSSNSAQPEFDLTQAECNDPAVVVGPITVSIAGSLYINSLAVTGDARAKVVNGVPGKWSFAYAMREILELPDPGIDPVALAAEQAQVKQFVNRFIQKGAVNSFIPPDRTPTRTALLQAWGKTAGADGINYLTFAKAPFKLVAIVNRLDLVKKGQTATSAGEGRFVYGFTGLGQMTVILEYDLAIGKASNKGMKNILDWAAKWRDLKLFLTDIDPVRPGVQPDQSVTAPLSFSDKAGYLGALESITELWANRTAQIKGGVVQAAIAQIRTNEILTSPWELREIVRGRDAAGKPFSKLTTVKNNPDSSFSSGANSFAAWIESNVTCASATDRTSCSYSTATGQLPGSMANDGVSTPLLGASAPESFVWFPGSSEVKQRFVALNTCSGCHTGETNTLFVHVSPFNGTPSNFLKDDLVKRLRNFKNLVCLAAATPGDLNLAGAAEADDLSAFRLDTSTFTH